MAGMLALEGGQKSKDQDCFKNLSIPQYMSIIFLRISCDIEYLYMGIKPIKPTIYEIWCGYTRRTTNNKSLLYLWQHHATKCAFLPETFARFFGINRWTVPGVAGLSITARNCHKDWTISKLDYDSDSSWSYYPEIACIFKWPITNLSGGSYWNWLKWIKDRLGPLWWCSMPTKGASP